jgi:hypothetical protein
LVRRADLVELRENGRCRPMQSFALERLRALFSPQPAFDPEPAFQCTAADAYATEHDRYAANLQRIHGWFREVGLVPMTGPSALRARVMPILAEDPLRAADFIGAASDAPSDEAARRRFFAKD